MVKFEHSTTYEYDNGTSRTVVEDTSDETIHDVVDTFVRFLKGMSFCETTIINGLLSKVDELKDSIKENYVMTQDDKETES